MNILFDIGHPGHVHLFYNLIQELKKQGNQVFVCTKNIPIVIQLLNEKKIEFINLGSKSDSILGKGLSQIKYNYKIYRLVKKHKIKLGIGTSVTIAHVSRITKMKSIVLDDDDDDVQPLFVKWVHPYCDDLLSPDALKNSRNRKNTVFYPGYHELAYLHPDRFTPDEEVLKMAGIKKGEPFFVLRFNAFKAHHDDNVFGLSLNKKKKLINTLLPYGKVFVTTEGELEDDLQKYQITIPASKIHSLMYYALLYCGDSQTMTTEAALLGTPAIKCNTLAGKLSVPNELEKIYSLCFSYNPEHFDQFIDKISELLSIDNVKEEWNIRRNQMLKDKIDVTSFLLNYLNEKYTKTQINHNISSPTIEQ